MAKVIRIHELGGPEVLNIEELAVGAPGAGEVRIRVEAVGLNRAEAMYRAGRYPVKPQLPSLIGYEGVGVIEEVGPGATTYEIGQRVCVLPMIRQGEYGIWGEEAIVPESILLPAPTGLSSAEAASIWMQYMTAFALIEVANIGIGDGVLIRAASSSVGIAAIQLANWAGSISIACTRTSEKAQALRDLGAAHVIATEEEDLVARTMAITGGKGARAAFDPVGGPYVETLATALGERGILFVYGGLSEQETPYPHWQCAFKGLSMRGWVASEIWNHPHRFKAAQEKILTGLETGHLRPVIARQFHGLDQLAEANAYLESNQQIGKVVVTF
ncbi:NADPH:quinone reductase-like Zn-dependent oxidoreductase [Altererythrobacter atlanticus]|uniref:Quinone oxidoreductase 1 n=1 Tax=Croceibacterium atlanticum TaxID=1267766 RepID=A0A0F7KLW2_9SPHN|nr:zinc-dependent alcohol dehydrogenase family protein [Croceibacterium atlanticum]AKH41523.1 Quinone oxidoreductase 1 [Croceibacterium atlanticum]MBB5732985.1 NADPH:quinone reductase-like Zn-dependent oxidoreductase [Croceibacterium atlanticum]